MKQVKLFLFATYVACTVFITNSCSQSTSSVKSNVTVFNATTPYDDIVKKLLHISSNSKYEMMKWHLALHNDPTTSSAGNYSLTCSYGLAKQGTRDLMAGAETLQLKGKWTVDKQKNKIPIYRLNADNSPIALSFAQPGPNLLHLLNGNDQMMIGTGAWSFTLNRTDPVAVSTGKTVVPVDISQSIVSDSLVIGVFDGRMPCNKSLVALNDISLPGCQLIKCRLKLYQDIKTHQPSTFELLTIYVGKGDNRYSTTGKWKMIQGTPTDPMAIVYQLDPGSGNLQSLLFLKADDNLLFFLDQDRHFLVGDGYTSYTLSKTRN
jgi:hypothetical protein